MPTAIANPLVANPVSVPSPNTTFPELSFITALSAGNETKTILVPAEKETLDQYYYQLRYLLIVKWFHLYNYQFLLPIR